MMRSLSKNRAVKPRLYACCLLWIALCAAGSGHSAEPGRGGYAGSFLRLGLGARSMGMGGGTVALADDGYAAYDNPAGPAFLNRRYFTSSLNSMALDRRLYALAYAQSIRGGDRGLLNAGFSVGWICAGVDGIDARDFSGNDAGTLSTWEHCFFFAFAMNPVAPVSIGLSGKLLYHRMPDLKDDGGALTAIGFGFDIGVIVKPMEHLRLGLTLKDLRSRYTWDTQELYERGTQTTDRFPVRFGAGVAGWLFSERLMLFGDVEQARIHKKVDDVKGYLPLSYTFGTQFSWIDRAFLRCGLRDWKLSFGLGYRHALSGRFIQLDYAYAPDPVAPRGVHVISWSFIF